MKRMKRKGILSIILFLALAIASFIIVAVFVSRMTEDIEDYTFSTLTDMGGQHREILTSKLEAEVNSVNVISAALASLCDGSGSILYSADAVELISDCKEASAFHRIGVATPDGVCKTSDGQTLNIFDRQYFQRSMQGEVYITEPTPSKIDGVVGIVISAPVHHDGHICGVVWGSYSTSELSGLILDGYDDEFATVNAITDRDGRIIMQGKSKLDLPASGSVFEALSTAEMHSVTVNDVREDFSLGRSRSFSYKYDGVQKLAYYIPLDVNGWMLYCMIPFDAAAKLYNSMIVTVYTIGAHIALLLGIVLAYIIINSKHVEHNLKAEKERLRISEERYRVIFNQYDNVIFEWDHSTGAFTTSPKFAQIYGWDCQLAKFPQDALDMHSVHENDVGVFLSVFSMDPNGSGDVRTGEMRILAADGGYIWSRILTTRILNSDGQTYRTVGTITDISAEREQTDKLKRMAGTDQMTGLLNAPTAQREISGMLGKARDGKLNALLIVDIDDFKVINEHFGRQFGDAVIIELADKIKKLFKATDVVGRMCGDEFVVLMTGALDVGMIKNNAARLCALCKSTYMDGREQIAITVSVGIAIVRQDGSDYAQLVDRADAALSIAKSSGKNTFKLYSDLTPEETFNSLKRKPSATMLDNKRVFAADNDIITQVFSLFYNSVDFDSTMSIVLSLLGRRFNIDHIACFAYNESRNEMIYRYEWCNVGITPRMRGAEPIARPAGADYINEFDESGLMCHFSVDEMNQDVAEVLRVSGIFSMLHNIIKRDGKIVGFVNFDQVVEGRVWKSDEIDALHLTAEMIGMFACTSAPAVGTPAAGASAQNTEK